VIYEILLIAVIAAVFRRGSFRRLQETEIKGSLLIIGCFLVQVAAMYAFDAFRFVRITFPIWVIASYLGLIYCCWENRRLPGFPAFGAGLLLNFLVIALNEGRMPVSVEALEWAGLTSYIEPLMEGITKHQPLANCTYLPFLADIIPLRPPYALSSRVVSAGDIVMSVGISRFFYKRMVKYPVR